MKYDAGYSRDIAWLFVGLARAAGLEASGVRVPSRSEHFFNEKTLNDADLDWSIAVVKVAGHDLYLDPGTPFVPFGLLSWAKTNEKGLKLDKDGGSWILTPLPESSASEIKRKADLKLTEEGNLEGKITISYTGLESCSRRLSERNQDDVGKKKYFEDLLKEYIPTAADVELKNEPDWKSTEKPLVAEFEVKIPGWVSSAGHNFIMPVGLFGGTEKHIFEHANRVNPVYFHYPFTKQDDVTVTIPTGWKVAGTPKDVDQDAKAAEYILKVEGKGDSVHVMRTIRCDLLVVSKDLYPALRGFFQAVKTADDEQIVVQPHAVAASK